MRKDENVQFADFEDTIDEWGWLIRAWTSLMHNIIDIVGVVRDVDEITGIIRDTDDIEGVIGRGTKP